MKWKSRERDKTKRQTDRRTDTDRQTIHRVHIRYGLGIYHRRER